MTRTKQGDTFGACLLNGRKLLKKIIYSGQINGLTQRSVTR